jgi:hypothetical protein
MSAEVQCVIGLARARMTTLALLPTRVLESPVTAILGGGVDVETVGASALARGRYGDFAV